jgi:hypothetical protein
VTSQEAIELCRKKKAKLSDSPYVPPEDVCNTKNKKNSKHTGKKSADNAEQGDKDGVILAVDDAEHEQEGVVSPTLTSFMLYEFIFYLNTFDI